MLNLTVYVPYDVTRVRDGSSIIPYPVGTQVINHDPLFGLVPGVVRKVNTRWEEPLYMLCIGEKPCGRRCKHRWEVRHTELTLN